MGDTNHSLRLRPEDPAAAAVVQAIRTGVLEDLRRILADDPALAGARIVNEKGVARTLLHMAADWPGFYPNGPETVAVLIQAGCDPSAPVEGSRHTETPLHWAASNDDVELARALIGGGADLEAQGGSIEDGGPLDNAVAYGCWRVARLLVERGARVNKLFHAAGLGMLDRVKEFCESTPPPESQRISAAFWHACNGGERRTAEYLLARGADVNWKPPWHSKPPLDAAMSLDTGRQMLISWLREQGAKQSRP